MWWKKSLPDKADPIWDRRSEWTDPCNSMRFLTIEPTVSRRDEDSFLAWKMYSFSIGRQRRVEHIRCVHILFRTLAVSWLASLAALNISIILPSLTKNVVRIMDGTCRHEWHRNRWVHILIVNWIYKRQRFIFPTVRMYSFLLSKQIREACVPFAYISRCYAYRSLSCYPLLLDDNNSHWSKRKVTTYLCPTVP